MKRLLFLLAFLVLPSMVSAKEAWRGFCEMGNRNVVTSGINSSTKVQQSFPQCTVSVFVNGGGLAVIYSDNNGTPLANPFISDTTGLWKFYAANGRYDVTTTQAGFPQPITYSDILLCDPVDATGGSCGPAVTPVAGCTLPGIDTGVLSEHPAGTCYDSVNWTWDDGTSKQNMQAGLDNTIGAGSSLAYALGEHHEVTGCLDCFVLGNTNTITTAGTTMFGNYAFGFNNSITDPSDTFIFGEGNSVDGPNNSFIWVFGVGNHIDATGTGNVSGMSLLESYANVELDGSKIDFLDIQAVGSEDSFIAGESSNANSNQINCLHGIGGQNTFQITAGQPGREIEAVSWVGKNNTYTSTGFNILYSLAAANKSTVSATSAETTDTGVFGDTLTIANCHDCFAFGENVSLSTNSTVAVGISAAAEELITAGHVALNAHLDQTAAGKFGNKCAMSGGTTCTFSISAAYTGTPLCVTSIDAASTVPATANVAKCSISGTTVTITAGIANSLTWDAILVGNPN